MRILSVLLLTTFISACATVNPHQSEYCFDDEETARTIGQTVYAPLMRSLKIMTEHTGGIGVFYGKVKNSSCGKGRGSVMFVYEPKEKNTLDEAQRQQVKTMGLERFNELMKERLLVRAVNSSVSTP
jgi:hypothetical protein